MNVGETIGHYRILGELGRGGMGVVYKAEQIALERFVALKALYPHLCSDPVTIMRFNREARTTALLNHPNVVQVFDVGQHEDIHFFSMEFVPGRTLAQILKQRGALPAQEVIGLADQVAAALSAGHDVGLLHRDIKPSNIIVTDDGRVKVTDFGIALVAGQGELTDTGHLVGTARYMAPEQARGDELDTRSDLYSLGIVIFEMLAGRVPYEADNPIKLLNMHLNDPLPDLAVLVPKAPKSLVELTEKLLTKVPVDRPRNVGQVRTQLRQAAAEIEWTGPPLPPLMSLDETAQIDPDFAFDAAGPLKQTADTVTLFVVDRVAPDNRLFGRLRRALERLIVGRLQKRRDSYKLQKLEVVGLRDQLRGAERQLESAKAECDRVYSKWENTDEALHEWQMTGSLAIRGYKKFEAEEAAEEEKHHWRRATGYKLQWHSLQEQVRDWYTNVERARQDYERARRDLEQLRLQRRIAANRSGVRRRNLIITVVLLALVIAATAFLLPRLWSAVATRKAPGFEKVGMLNAPRDESAAVRLPDGKVLVVGGVRLAGQGRLALKSAELYDPAARTFTPTEPPVSPRFNHTLDVLPDGTVLVVGGENLWGERDALRSAEEYSPDQNRFAQIASLIVGRTRHRSVILPDGRLLVCGGCDANGVGLKSVELFDAKTHRFTHAGSLNVARKDHTLTALPDGTVLVIGGSRGSSVPLDSIELYDPASGRSKKIGQLTYARYEHAATLLPSGMVLVTGGRRGQRASDMLDKVELVNPGSGMSNSAAPLAYRRKVHTATITTWHGKPGVLVVGGGSKPGSEACEFYDFATATFGPGPRLNYNRNNHIAVALADGALLILGGFGTDARTPLQTAELYTPEPGPP